MATGGGRVIYRTWEEQQGKGEEGRSVGGYPADGVCGGQLRRNLLSSRMVKSREYCIACGRRRSLEGHQCLEAGKKKKKKKNIGKQWKKKSRQSD